MNDTFTAISRHHVAQSSASIGVSWTYLGHICPQPQGLRHSFGINAVQKKIPLNLVQKWLGHAQLQTTAIYANAVGEEERNIAEAMWKN